MQSEKDLKQVVIYFPEVDLTYDYLCESDKAIVGYGVEVSGKLQKHFGIIKNVSDVYNQSDYMKHVNYSFNIDDIYCDKYESFFYGYEVVVYFPDIERSYSYNYFSKNVQLGDEVLVSGKLFMEKGVIKKINKEINTDHMIQIVIMNFRNYDSRLNFMKELFSYRCEQAENHILINNGLENVTYHVIDLNESNNIHLCNYTAYLFKNQFSYVKFLFKLRIEKDQINEHDFHTAINYYGGESWDEDGYVMNHQFELLIEGRVFSLFSIEQSGDEGKFFIQSATIQNFEYHNDLNVETIYRFPFEKN